MFERLKCKLGLHKWEYPEPGCQNVKRRVCLNCGREDLFSSYGWFELVKFD